MSRVPATARPRSVTWTSKMIQLHHDTACAEHYTRCRVATKRACELEVTFLRQHGLRSNRRSRRVVLAQPEWLALSGHLGA